jgi:hypothetical protein
VTKVIVSLSDAASDALQKSLGISELGFDVRYDKLLKRSEATSDRPAVEEVVSRSERRWVSQRLPETLELDGVTGAEIAVVLLNAWGVDGVVRHFPVTSRGSVECEIDEETIAALRASSPPDPTDEAPLFFPRRAKLVPVGGPPPSSSSSILSVAIVPSDFEPTDLGLPAQGPGSVLLDADGIGALQRFHWTGVKLGVDGSFEARFPQSSAKGWLWWLSSSVQVVGYVPESFEKPHRDQVMLSLPPLPETSTPGGESPQPAGEGPVVPADPSETEIVENPQVYSEDPGTFCKPFSNPERVLSERSFHVIVRVTQPEIGPRPSRKIKQQVFLNVDLLAARAGAATASGTIARTRPGLADVVLDVLPVRNLPPSEYVDEVDTMPVGRQRLSAEHPVQWEDDIAQYQASSIALGHIIDYRIRWRSNGYSLGKVGSSLTLAPRQVKRVQKIQFERLERARREESTTFAEDVSDTVDSAREYDDQVAATLSEWSSGSSYSRSKAGAVGAGFAMGGFVIGGGATASSASSGSDASGSRTSTASEMQRLVDSIRRHGDSLRKFESTVMTEVSQTEIVTGTSEVVRNFNYGRSLTIIYHQILRHLKVTTEFGGVRQCLFVPFALSPFNVTRATRWRESIENHLRDERFRPTIGHLREVATNFANSKILPGKRSIQPLTYLRGSLYLTMRIERPQDGENDAYDAAKWLAISNLAGAPPYSIWAKLARLDRAARDLRFQQEDAPPIATKWIDKLLLQAGSQLLDVDFTLASSYGYGRQVRVDFNVRGSLAGLNRELIKTLTVTTKTENTLTPASSVVVDRAVVRYGTARFQKSLSSEPGRDDLIAPDTGAPDPQGAVLDFPLDPEWDDVDERQEIRNSVAELVEHLNEQVEHYHKAIWWNMDRDRLLMMLDGFYVPWAEDVSVASVVEREPIAIVGNSLVYTVSPAMFLKTSPSDSRAALHNRYATDKPISDPLHVSLPTDGLYAQSVLDECIALEEHRGSTDWVLDQAEIDPDSLDPSLLGSRRAEPGGATAPTSLPASIINLQNAPAAPLPSGLEGVLGAVTNANAFRDMAGLAGTQANAAAAMQAAASLATNFGNQAAALELTKMAKAEQATRTADQKVASIKNAVDKGLVTQADAAKATNDALSAMNPDASTKGAPHENAAINSAIDSVKDVPGSIIEADTGEGHVKVTRGGAGEDSTRSWIIEPADQKAWAKARAFHPSASGGDKSGVTKLIVRTRPIPEGGSVRWSVPPNQIGRYTLKGSARVESGLTADITGIQPGGSAIDFDVFDAKGNSIESQKYPLSIPQFVTVDVDPAFTALLTGYGLIDFEIKQVLGVAREVCHAVLRSANVRTIWLPLGETLPAQFGPGKPGEHMVTHATFLDTAGVAGRLGRTFQPFGPNIFNERIEVYAGAFDDPASGSAVERMDDVTAAVIQTIVTSALSSSVEKDLGMQILGRAYGETLAHEIGHSLIGEAPLSGGDHNSGPPGVSGDLMNRGADRSFEVRTGCSINGTIITPIRDNISLLPGIDFINVPTGTAAGTSQGEIDANFPVPPTFR